LKKLIAPFLLVAALSGCAGAPATPAPASPAAMPSAEKREALCFVLKSHGLKEREKGVLGFACRRAPAHPLDELAVRALVAATGKILTIGLFLGSRNLSP
jgi:hypothetical protein